MSPAPQGQQPTDNHMAALWLTLGAFIVIAVVWYFFSAQIIYVIFEFKAGELWLISLIDPSAKPLYMKVLNDTYNSGNVTFTDMTNVLNQVGAYLIWPALVILLIFFISLVNRGAGKRFKTIYSMKTLLQKEYKNWPQTTPILKKDLVKQGLEEGPWAMSQTPLLFAKKNHLLKVHQRKQEEGQLKKQAGLQATVVKNKANQLFVKQLGPLWRGPERLPMHIKALFVVFAIRVAGASPDIAHDLLMQISRSADGGKLDFSKVNKLLEQYGSHKEVKKICRRHAYVYTVMTSMLKGARSVGVLACADFLWLKLIDRRLWFVLNSVGRQTPFVEAAGPFAHWLIETELEHAFRTPMVDNAGRALEEAIAEQIYREES